MSEENVEVPEAIADSFNRRDVSALSALLSPDVQIVPIRAALEGDTAYAGPNAAAEWFAAVDQSWEGLTTEIDEVVDRGDCVVGFGRARGRGRESAVEIDVVVASIARFRDGLVTYLRISTDRDAIREAAGMSE